MFNTSFNSDFRSFLKEKLVVWKVQVMTELIGGGFSIPQFVVLQFYFTFIAFVRAALASYFT